MADRGNRLLVLDMGGVVMRDPVPALLDRIADESSARSRDEVWARYFERHLDLWSGRLGEDAFWDRMLGFADLEDRRNELRDFLIDGIEPIPPVLRRLEDWSREVELWALTNHLRDWIRPALEKHGMNEHFDMLLISDETGNVKPDTPAEIAHSDAFSDLVNRWPAGADRILYVDDKQVNLDAAAIRGVAGVLADPDSRWVGAVDRWIAHG